MGGNSHTNSLDLDSADELYQSADHGSDKLPQRIRFMVASTSHEDVSLLEEMRILLTRSSTSLLARELFREAVAEIAKAELERV